MFTSIRTKSALFLGLLSFSALSVAEEQSDQIHYVEKRLVSSKNNPYNPFVLPTAELQKKLKNRWVFFKNSETQKIIDLLLADPAGNTYPRDIDMFLSEDIFEDILASAKKITFHFDDGDYTITKEQYLANRQLLFSNPYIIKVLIDYMLQLKKYPGVHYDLWEIPFLIIQPEFRKQMTAVFIKDLDNALSENGDDKEIYFFNRRYGTYDVLIEFIGALKKQNDTYNLNKLANYLRNHVPRIINHTLLDAIEKK